jgi:Bacterial TniB protein
MTGDLGHLLPECREEARSPAQERIERIQAQRWISYPRAEPTLRGMDEPLRYSQRDRMPSLPLYGPTGMGKTKIIRKFVRYHPAVFDAQVGILETSVVAMQMPLEPDEKS